MPSLASFAVTSSWLLAASLSLINAVPTPGIPAIQKVPASAWAALNSQVGGRLHPGVPWARPCFANAGAGVGGSYDPTGACPAIQQTYKNDSFIVENFGGYQNTNWGTCQTTGEQCLLDYNLPQNPLATTTRTCSQGSVPSYYVEVANYQDVQAVFAFAKKYKVPLTIKNSGHDYKGRSSGPYTLAMWTHKLQGITRNKAFRPTGCAATVKTVDTVTALAGNGFLSLYQYAENNGITVVGGSSETVGFSGGWITGGGHSSLSNTLGLGVDLVQEMKVVTPDGQYLTINACQNQDLFFAFRGGGGGTFGVVMSTTTKVYPAMKIQAAYLRFISVDPTATQQFMAAMIAQATTLADGGWGGYVEPAAMTSAANGFVLFTPKLTNAQATAQMAPIFAVAKKLGSVALDATVTEMPTFLQAYNKFLVPNEEVVGIQTALASRLIPRANFATSSSQSQLLQAIMGSISLTGNNVLNPNAGTLPYGGAPTQILVTAPSSFKTYPNSSVTPAWRNTLWHVLSAPTFNYDATPSQIQQLWRNANTAMNLVRAITPDAAYQNEADIHEPNHTVSFWGAANYAKLVTIKRRVDPNKLLNCWHCVDYDATDSRFACYPSL